MLLKQDNASYHSSDKDAPKANASAKKNIEFLDKKGIQFPDEWRKRGFAKQLKQKVKEVKENNPDRNAEMMARKYGHTILRLPRNTHCLEILAWIKKSSLSRDHISDQNYAKPD